MATYTPALYPRRPKYSNPLTELRYELQLAYYRYELNTGQYVMSQTEKLIFNLIVLSTLSMFFLAVYYYLPSSVTLSVRRLAYYLTGSVKTHVDALEVASVVQGTIEAAASLTDSSNMVVNGTMAFY